MKIDHSLITIISNARILGDYSCGTYGANAYGSACEAESDLLADTGYNILLPLALGAALIIAAVILTVKRIRRRHATNS